MKRVLTLITTIVLAMTAFADNRIYIEDSGYDVGTDIVLPVYMTNTDSITAFQFDLFLPEDLTLGEEGITLDTERTTVTAHNFTFHKVDYGWYRAICYSTGLNLFKGSEGAIARIHIATPEALGSYEISISDIEMTKPDLTKITCDDVTAHIKVGSGSSADNEDALKRFMEKYEESVGVYNAVKAETVDKLLDEEGNVINKKYEDLVTEFIAALDSYKEELDSMKLQAEAEYTTGELPDNIEMYIATLTYSDKSIQESQKTFLMAMENLDKYIALGDVGTCIWYITNDGQLVIMPEDGESGDLPETGWDKDNMTPWYAYRSDIKSAKVLGVVNATSCAFMFSDLTNMETIDLGGLNTKHAVNMENMFASCHNLLALDVSNLITENAVHMESMFKECYSLKSLDVSNFDTHSAIMMNGMFKECSGLTSLDISNFNTENVTRMYSMFNDCTNLKTLNLTNFNTVNVEDLSNIFDGCDSLTTIISNNATPSSLKPGTFSESFVTRTNCSLIVPEGTMALYAAADGWNELGKIDDGTSVGPEIPADAIASGETGTCIWYITSEGELVIAPADGVSGDLPEDGWEAYNPWFGYRYNILSAKVMPGVSATSCSKMFYELENMASVDLSGLNTQNVTDMSMMFLNCPALTSLDLSNFNTQNVTDMHNMFAACYSLTSLDISSFNTQNVTNMYSMFWGCPAPSLDLSNFDTQNVTNMGYMFQNCEATSIDLSNFNTQNVTDMHNMFNCCNYLTSLDLSNFDTKNVTSMSKMFSGCHALTSLDLSNFDTKNVTSMSKMFSGCHALTSLGLSNFNTQNVEDMEDMFTGCDALTTIISNRETPSTLRAYTFETFANRANCTLLVPEGTKALYAAADGWNELGKILDGTEPVGPEIPADAIASGEVGTCIWYITSEGELVIAPADGVSGDLPEEGWNLSNHAPWYTYRDSIESARIESGVKATTCNYMFYSLENIKTIDLSNLNTENVTYMGGMFDGCSALKSLNLSNFNTQNVRSMRSMFHGCSALTSLDLSNYNTQNVTSMEGMFYGCSALKILNLSNFETQNVTDMGGMFNGCSALTSLDLSNFNTQNVTMMSNMFVGCSSLTSLDLSNFNTQNVRYMVCMFYGCSALTSLDLSNYNTQNVTSMEGMFDGCSALKILNLSYFDTQNVTNMVSMFCGCSSLTSLDLSNFNTQNVTNMGHMFYGCSSLTSLDLSNFDTQNVTNMVSMFCGCSSLTSLDLSNFNTKNVTDMDFMFEYCSALTSLDLSNFNMQSVKDMSYMFYGCNSLKTIISNNEIPSQLKVGTFGTFANRANCTLVVPEGTKDLYAAADGWNELGKIDDGTTESTNEFATINFEELGIPYKGDGTISMSDGTILAKSENVEMSLAFGQDVSYLALVPYGEDATYNVSDGKTIVVSYGLLGTDTPKDANGKAPYSSLSAPVSGHVYKLVSKKDGYMTVLVKALPNKTVSVFEDGRSIPYVFGMSNERYASASYQLIGNVDGFIDTPQLYAEAMLYHREPNYTGDEVQGPGIIRFKVEAGKEYLVFNNGSKLQASGYYFTQNDDDDLITVSSFYGNDCVLYSQSETPKLYTVYLSSKTKNVTFEGFGGYQENSTVTIKSTLTPDEEQIGFRFSEWSDGNINNPRNLTVTGNIQLMSVYSSNILAKGECGSCTWTLNKDGELVIAPNSENGGELDNWVAKGEKAPWDEYSDEVCKVTIEDGVGGIKDGMLGDLGNLEYVSWNTGKDNIPQGIFGTEENNVIIYAPQGVDSDRDHNVVIDGVAEKIILKDGYPLEIPEAFEANYIYYVRDFSKATKTGHNYGWESIVLPYDVQHFVHESKGNLAPFGMEGTTKRPFWLSRFTHDGDFAFANEMKANVPYIIAMPNDSIYDKRYILAGKVAFISYNTTVYPTDEAESVESGRATMHGSYVFNESPDYYVINDDIFDGYMPGAVFGSGLTVKPFSAYLDVYDNQWEANKRVFIINVNDNENIVDGIFNVNGNDNDKVVYDLNGIRINPSQMKRGSIYLKLKNSNIEKFKY